MSGSHLSRDFFELMCGVTPPAPRPASLSLRAVAGKRRCTLLQMHSPAAAALRLCCGQRAGALHRAARACSSGAVRLGSLAAAAAALPTHTTRSAPVAP
eukprot:1242781-Prymnesium_polylepis.1